MSGLIDLTGVSACCADEALELLHKAKADPSDHAGILQPHHEPLLAQLIETSWPTVALIEKGFRPHGGFHFHVHRGRVTSSAT